MALVAPAGFIFAHAVLQVQYWEPRVGLLVIIRRSVNEAAPGRVAGLGEIVDLPQMAVRHVLDSVEVLVFGGDFDTAAPTVAAVEIQAAGVRDPGAIDDELVIVETFVLRPRDADPGAVVTLGQRVGCAAQELERDALGLGRDDAGPNAAFGVDLRILFARLVGCRGFPVVRRLVGLGHAKLAQNHASKREQWECCFHREFWG